MLATRRTTPAGRPLPLTRAVAATFVLTLGTAACTEQASPAPPPAEQATSAPPLSAYDEDGAALVPRDPCSGMGADRVADALGAEAGTSVTWAPGQRVPGTSEIADEHGCRFAAGDVSAAAWVFAVPTSPAQARRLVAEATGRECRPVRRAETFGDPGVAFSCAEDTGRPRTGMRGLVGSSWVSCEIAGTDDTERVGRWCASVLESLAAR